MPTDMTNRDGLFLFGIPFCGIFAAKPYLRWTRRERQCRTPVSGTRLAGRRRAFQRPLQAQHVWPQPSGDLLCQRVVAGSLQTAIESAFVFLDPRVMEV